MSCTLDGRGVEEDDAAPDIGDLDEHTGDQLPTGGIVPDLHRHCPPWRRRQDGCLALQQPLGTRAVGNELPPIRREAG